MLLAACNVWCSKVLACFPSLVGGRACGAGVCVGEKVVRRRRERRGCSTRIAYVIKHMKVSQYQLESRFKEYDVQSFSRSVISLFEALRCDTVSGQKHFSYRTSQRLCLRSNMLRMPTMVFKSARGTMTYYCLGVRKKKKNFSTYATTERLRRLRSK